MNKNPVFVPVAEGHATDRSVIKPASDSVSTYNRHIYLGLAEYQAGGDKHEAIQRWLEANNIDPSTVPVTQVVTVSGELIQFTQFVIDREGSRRLYMGGLFGGIFEKTIVTAVVTQYPEVFGL